jgi:hypothetical protein
VVLFAAVHMSLPGTLLPVPKRRHVRSWRKEPYGSWPRGRGLPISDIGQHSHVAVTRVVLAPIKAIV